jgi:D-alanyl-D-alanine carboxypeptidase
MRQTRQPGCSFAVAYKGRVVFERAYGYANADKGERLTPRHRFRVASHSKTFTATAILKLRETGKLSLDDSVGGYVDGLHPEVAKASLTQLLSHGAGLVRDGADASQWRDERPFADKSELLAALAKPLVITPDTRMKYSNHGFGLLGLVIEAVTGESYTAWINRNIVAISKLKETVPDGPLGRGIPMARGHSAELPLGYRVIIPGDNPTNALAAATGFISTAADLARFFSSLDPTAKTSVLSPASRRAMHHKQWSDPHTTAETQYGMGLIMGCRGGWEWAGHAGGFQSGLSYTRMLPGRDLCFSILTNAIDGPVNSWSEGILSILKTFASNGLPTARTRPWAGRWWNMWHPCDLIPFSDRVLVASPGETDPFAAAEEITVMGKDRGVISLAGGYSSHGEDARLVRGRDGYVREVWLGGQRWVSERRLKTEIKRKYGK